MDLVTTTEPNAGEHEPGRHATSHDTEREADPVRRPDPREEILHEPKKKRPSHALAHHPAGASLLTAAELVTGLALAPLLFDQLAFEIAARAADAARSAAAPWPAGGALVLVRLGRDSGHGRRGRRPRGRGR